MQAERTAAELARVTEVANDLVKALNNAWAAMEWRSGELPPADFVEAMLMAAAGVTAAQFDPAGDQTAQRVGCIQLFTHALRVEMSAAKARGDLP